MGKIKGSAIAGGNRIKSEFYNTSSSFIHYYFYLGSTPIAHNKYETSSMTVEKQFFIGNGREGMYRKLYGQMVYELKDHLGNVRLSYFYNDVNQEVQINSWADYYPYGHKLPGRQYNTTSYPAGFQGQEDALYSNLVNFDLRMYHPGLGQFMSIDPYNQFHSPYVGMGNDPVNGVDPSGGYWYGTAAEYENFALRKIRDQMMEFGYSTFAAAYFTDGEYWKIENQLDRLMKLWTTEPEPMSPRSLRAEKRWRRYYQGGYKGVETSVLVDGLQIDLNSSLGNVLMDLLADPGNQVSTNWVAFDDKGYTHFGRDVLKKSAQQVEQHEEVMENGLIEAHYATTGNWSDVMDVPFGDGSAGFFAMRNSFNRQMRLGFGQNGMTAKGADNGDAQSLFLLGLGLAADGAQRTANVFQESNVAVRTAAVRNNIPTTQIDQIMKKTSRFATGAKWAGRGVMVFSAGISIYQGYDAYTQRDLDGVTKSGLDLGVGLGSAAIGGISGVLLYGGYMLMMQPPPGVEGYRHQNALLNDNTYVAPPAISGF